MERKRRRRRRYEVSSFPFRRICRTIDWARPSTGRKNVPSPNWFFFQVARHFQMVFVLGSLSFSRVGESSRFLFTTFLVGRWQSSVIESGVLSFPPPAFFLPPSLARQIKMTDGLSPFGYPLPPPPKSYRTDNHQNWNFFLKKLFS